MAEMDAHVSGPFEPEVDNPTVGKRTQVDPQGEKGVFSGGVNTSVSRMPRKGMRVSLYGRSVSPMRQQGRKETR